MDVCANPGSTCSSRRARSVYRQSLGAYENWSNISKRADDQVGRLPSRLGCSPQQLGCRPRERYRSSTRSCTTGQGQEQCGGRTACLVILSESCQLMPPLVCCAWSQSERRQSFESSHNHDADGHAWIMSCNARVVDPRVHQPALLVAGIPLDSPWVGTAFGQGKPCNVPPLRVEDIEPNPGR